MKNGATYSSGEEPLVEINPETKHTRVEGNKKEQESSKKVQVGIIREIPPQLENSTELADVRAYLSWYLHRSKNQIRLRIRLMGSQGFKVSSGGKLRF